MSQILILDNDRNTVETISRFLTAVQLQPATHIKRLGSLNIDEVKKLAGIIIDVEIRNLAIDELYELLSDAGEEVQRNLPIIYLYSNPESEPYRKAMEYPPNGELQKPVQLGELSDLLTRFFTLDALLDRPRMFAEQQAEHYQYLENTHQLLKRITPLVTRGGG